MRSNFSLKGVVNVCSVGAGSVDRVGLSISVLIHRNFSHMGKEARRLRYTDVRIYQVIKECKRTITCRNNQLVHCIGETCVDVSRYIERIGIS